MPEGEAGALGPRAEAAPAPPAAAGARSEVLEVDALEGLARLAGKVSVIVTSPPYNIGKPYGAYDDRRPEAEYLEWMGRVGAACARALEPDGALFLNVGGRPSDPMLPIRVAGEFARHLRLQNTVVWVKSIALPRESLPHHLGLEDDLTVGHYQPVNSPAFLNGCFEYVFHLTPTGRNPLDKLAIGVRYQDKSNVVRWRGEDLRDRGNTWFVPYETIRESRPHPAPFPPKLPELCLRLHGVGRARLVVDPFLGIGSTGVACARLGLPFVGFEIDAGYARIARERIAEARLRPPDAPA